MARKVWGLEERICRNDFRRKWTLFSTKCNGIRGRSIGMEEGRIGKGNDGLCKMDV